MKKTLCLLAFLTLTLIGFGQNIDYYYYKSKKINLYKSNSQHFILTNEGRSELLLKLSQENFSLKKMHPNNVRSSFSKGK